ncbi:MAG: hypothetical protein AAF944_15735 [Bacteroidota bacterium]
MVAVFTLLLLIILELAGLYVAGSIGQAVRSMFKSNLKKNPAPSVRWQNVMIGYGVIFGFFILLLLL